MYSATELCSSGLAEPVCLISPAAVWPDACKMQLNLLKFAETVISKEW